MERKCENCDHVGNDRFIVAGGGRQELPGSLVCRRYPPRVVIEHQPDRTSATTKWPNVDADDRCGEFTPKPTG